MLNGDPGSCWLAAYKVALGTVCANARPDSHILMTRLALVIPQLPAAARARTFHVLLALRTNWLTQNADVIGALRFVAASLTNLRFGFGHQTAMEQLAAAERLATPAPSA